jgi:hypothetical protein
MMKEFLQENAGPMLDRVNRRYFLRSAGVAASAGALIMGCTIEDHNIGNQAVDLGSGDIGILNYAYALEQLEAAFYTQVIKTPYVGMSMEEKTILTDIMYHEIIHRQFFKAALGGAAIKGLTPNFAGIDFLKRDDVLKYAKIFEDTGVAAYNGAGKLITNPGYLLIAGKIVSVEARHASAIRDLISPNSALFAGDDVVDMNGLDGAMPPSAILMAVAPFVTDKIDGSHLPS